MYFRIASRNLLQARRRTLFLGSALAIVTMLLVLLLSLSQGLSETMIRSATTLSAGHVNVGGFYKAKPTDAIPLVTDYERVIEIVEKNTPGLDYVIDRQRGWARVISDTGAIFSALNGIDISRETGFREIIRLAPESEYKDGGRDEVQGSLDDLAAPNAILIFESHAKRLDVGVGDPLTLSSQTPDGVANTVDVRVAAVAQDMGFMSGWNIYAARATVDSLNRLAPNTTGAVMVYLKDPSQANQTMGTLRDAFLSEGYELMEHVPQPFFMKFEGVSGEDWTGQRLDLTTWRDEVSYLQWVLTAIDSISFALLGILTIIIAIGIMNALWIAVRERTQEIGTLRAIGMTRARVLKMFMGEALLLGLLATTVGALSGAAIAAIVDAAEIHIPIEAVQALLMSDTLHLSVHGGQLAMAIASFTLITGLSALWPAAKASRMQPVTAIHHVG